MDFAPAAPPIRRARATEIELADLYRALRLRAEVFVVEQDCPYLDVDGRDLEPTTEHLWIDDDAGTMLGYLRLLAEPDGVTAIGRVVTATAARGRGFGRNLMTAAVERIGDGAAVLGAQTYAREFYRAFGFVEDGPEYLEDGIPHVPMRRVPAR